MYLVMNEITKLISRMCHEPWLLVSSAVASCVKKTTFSGSDRKLNLSLPQRRSKFQSTGVPVTGSKFVHKVTLERHRICALWPELVLLFIACRIWVDCVRYHVTILRQQGIAFLFSRFFLHHNLSQNNDVAKREQTTMKTFLARCIIRLNQTPQNPILVVSQ